MAAPGSASLNGIPSKSRQLIFAPPFGDICGVEQPLEAGNGPVDCPKTIDVPGRCRSVRILSSVPVFKTNNFILCWY